VMLNFFMIVKSYMLEEEVARVLLPDRLVLEIRLAMEVLR